MHKCVHFGMLFVARGQLSRTEWFVFPTDCHGLTRILHVAQPVLASGVLLNSTQTTRTYAEVFLTECFLSHAEFAENADNAHSLLVL